MPNMVKISQGKKKFIRIPYRAWTFSLDDKSYILNNDVFNKSKLSESRPCKHKKNRGVVNQAPVNGCLDSVKLELAETSTLLDDCGLIKEGKYQSKLTTKNANIPVSGKELDLLLFLCNICIKTCSLKTPEVTTSELNSFLNVKSNRLRNIILRVTKKKMVTVIKSNCGGSSAYRIFEFTKQIYDKLLYKLTSCNFINGKFSSCLVGWHSIDKNHANMSLHKDNEFKGIDYEILSGIGFNRSHIIQIQREYKNKPEVVLPIDIIQDSIDAMAFDLKHNDVAKDFKISPAAVLTSLLKKGIPYSSKTPERFKTPQQEAMDEFLTFQEKKVDIDRQIKSRIKEMEFEKWQKNLTEKELLELCPKSSVVASVSEKIRKTIRILKAKELSKDYFNVEVWPELKKNVEKHVNKIINQSLSRPKVSS